MAIWVVEQRDPSELLYSCIACCDELQAQDCVASFQQNLSAAQLAAGWNVTIHTVATWDEVPVSALKLN